MNHSLLFQYTLHLADNALVLSQRNSEWCGHGPVLEQDIAITNISLDLLGQARNLYQYAASLYNHSTGYNSSTGEQKGAADHYATDSSAADSSAADPAAADPAANPAADLATDLVVDLAADLTADPAAANPANTDLTTASLTTPDPTTADLTDTDLTTAGLTAVDPTRVDVSAVDFFIPRPWKTFNRELHEDDLAYLRDESQYLNLLLVELPKGDWAQTILRQFFFSAFQFIQYKQLQQSNDPQLAAIAEKSVKEVAYHLRWSSEWVVRLGDGTEESRRRIKKAVDELWSFTGEMFVPSAYEQQAVQEGFGVDVTLLKEAWMQKVSEVFGEAQLIAPGIGETPNKTWMQTGGKEGRHTEYLGYILTEMQYLQRTYPNSVW